MKTLKILAFLSLTSASLARDPITYEVQHETIGENIQQLQQNSNNRNFARWFAESEKLYPNLPKGFLAGFAYTTTNWNHITPDNNGLHNELKFAGVMGLLYDNSVGFRNTFSEVAKNYRVSEKEMLLNPRLEIIATADFVSSLLAKLKIVNAKLEDMQPIAEYISGLPIPQSNKAGDIDAFAMDSLFYDILLINQKGHDDNGLTIVAKKVQWQKAFTPQVLEKQQVNFIDLDLSKSTVEIDGYSFDKKSQSLISKQKKANKATVDYPTARWETSPNHSTRGSTSITHIAIHRMEGYYASSIALFKRTSKQVSAHYLIRSSDGQVTQMVREYRKAWHIGNNNRFTIGLEHEGFSRNTSKLTTAMYESSANLVKSICDRRNINCAKTYDGPGNRAHRKDVLPKSQYTVKGHAHYPTGTHWDPGPFWNWNRFHTLINGSSQTQYTILDSFEGSEGHFDTKPTHSGSTHGISASSFAIRSDHNKRNGNFAEQIKLVDDPNTHEDWRVRFLSASGRPANNRQMAVNGGTVGFWVYAGGSGMSVGLSIDDSDGTEQSDVITLPTRAWTFVSWQLDKSSDWNTWVSGNGRLDANNVTLDAIWFHRAETSWDVFMYIDDVQYFK